MRVIDANKLIECKFKNPISYAAFCNLVKRQPTVDAIPVVHSEWIPKEKADTPYGLEMECAKCEFSVVVNDALYFKFCPNCGARMDGKDGDHHED